MTDSHARSLESVVQDMLPSRCATVCTLVGNDETSPYLEERNQVQGYAANRMNECFAGRRAARRVVNAMGASPLLYRQRFGGEPIWPQGFIGSITHTGRVALAVAARSSTAHSIGVDFEVEQTIPTDQWDIILHPSEIAQSGSLHPLVGARSPASFSPQRRTFHKMQYKTTCDFIDYAEVAMELELDQGLVNVKNIRRSRKLDSLNCFYIEGRHKAVEGHTLTAFTAK
jgi:4'-phosphopantetheinyl transferase EntD